MSSQETAHRYRPSAPLRIPLQTGDGFSMSLFMWAAFWMPALTAGIAGVALIFFGHWLLGPLLALVGAFLVGAFWSFPRDVWVSRPCDLELDAQGLRVLGGYRGGTSIGWDDLDAAASGLRSAESLLATELVAVTRSGKRIPLAEGEEHDTFVAALDAFRASEGLAPVPPRHTKGHYQAVQLEGSAALTERGKKPSDPERRERVVVQVLKCNGCGAAACPVDAAHATCRYCEGQVRMSDALRERLREMSAKGALREKSRRALERLLAQPSAPITMALLGVLAATMLVSWLFSAAALVISISRGTLDGKLVLIALALPLLLALALAILASVVASRRVAVREVAIEFAAVAPERAGGPYGCRVCGAPLPELNEPVVPCAYCTASNVVHCARPRAPSRFEEQRHTLEETLESKRAEQVVRQIFLAVGGVPALYAAYLAFAALLERVMG
jgi:hypothetical protein